VAAAGPVKENGFFITLSYSCPYSAAALREGHAGTAPSIVSVLRMTFVTEIPAHSDVVKLGKSGELLALQVRSQTPYALRSPDRPHSRLVVLCVAWTIDSFLLPLRPLGALRGAKHTDSLAQYHTNVLRTGYHCHRKWDVFCHGRRSQRAVGATWIAPPLVECYKRDKCFARWS